MICMNEMLVKCFPSKHLHCQQMWFKVFLCILSLINRPALKIINLSKWCLKQQVSNLANSNAIFLLDYSQMLITYCSD